MYVPAWLIAVIVGIGIYYYLSQKKEIEGPTTVEDIKKEIVYLKERIFSFEHFDSPHFIDVQNAFDAMEINYLRLKQRFIHTPEKVLEIAKDWYRYVDALRELKNARIMLDVDWTDDAFDNLRESSKEPSVVKEEIEKKFKSLLGESWQEVPPDYFQRMDTMKEPTKKELTKFKIEDDWKYYYRDSENLYRLEQKRREKKKTEEESKSE